jgi:hypothetical protein
MGFGGDVGVGGDLGFGDDFFVFFGISYLYKK